MLEHLFEFPIVMVDRERGTGEFQETEMVYGRAEVPHTDTLVGISDRWLPREESYQKALDGKFEACLVSWNMIGSYLVPLTREQFKKRYDRFLKTLPKEESNIKYITIDELKQYLSESEEQDGK